MSASSSARTKVARVGIAPRRTDTGPGEIPLYFSNKGLFSDTYLLHHLPEEKSDPFILQHWETEPLPSFSEAYEWMLSTWNELKEILPTLSEAQLEERWVRPVLKKLSWEWEVQDRLKKRGKTQIPDYSLFKDLDAYKKSKAAKTDDAYFSQVLAVADAKAMGISLDGTSRSNQNPSYQIIRYLEDTGKSWGILTDGLYWRLYSTRSDSRFTTYYEVNIESLLAKRDDERFKYFFNFFRKDAFIPNPASDQSFLDVVFEGGEQYAKQVETRLKDRAFHLVEQLCTGFAASTKAKTREQLDEVYSHSLYFVFRLMFVLNCEAKGLLRVDKQSDYYSYSLRSLCVRLKEEFEAGRGWSEQPRTYNYIQDLFRLLRDGDNKIGIHGFGNEIFSSGDPAFYDRHKIPDSILNNVLVELSCAYDEEGTLKFIDYKRLSADHLGSLFEGLLEFEPTFASEKLVNVNGSIKPWKEATEKQRIKFKDFVISSGQLYLSSDSTERKKLGAYYTPDYVVDYIVRQALETQVKGLSAKEILKLRVIDPAMGSGHFLLGAVRFLEEETLDRMYANGESDSGIDPQEIRWQILHSCIYGVDINPLAVELAKFSLWMYTARTGFQLELLSDQLKCGNSLVGNDIKECYPKIKLEENDLAKIRPFVWESEYSDIFGGKDPGFDAVFGNPPYVSMLSLDKQQHPRIKPYWKDKFASAAGAYDIYILFVELALKLVKKEQLVSFILPNKFLAAEYAIEFRKMILERSHFVSLLDLSKTKVWDVSVYPVIMTLRNSLKEAKDDLIVSTMEGEQRSLKKIASVPQTHLRKTPDLIWSFITQPGVEILLKVIDHSVPLEQVAEVCGASTVAEGSDYPKLVVNSGPENSTTARFVVSGTVFRYRTTWSREPVQFTGKKYSKPVIQLKAPMPKRRREQAKQAKLVMCKVALSPRSYIDLKGEYVGAYTTYIFADKLPLGYLAAVINSKLMAFVFRTLYDSLAMGGGYLRFQPPQMRRLPMPVEKDEKALKKIAEKLDKLALKLQVELNKDVSKEWSNSSENEINDYIYELFSLNKKEIQLVENWFDENLRKQDDTEAPLDEEAA